MKASFSIATMLLGRTTSPLSVLQSLKALSPIATTGTPSMDSGITRDEIPSSYPITTYPSSPEER